MKVTYKDFQIEISVEEIITLIDHANLTDAGTQLVKEIEHYKEELHDEEPKPYSKQAKGVDILFEEGWKTFDSMSKAAKALDVSLAWLSKSLQLGKTCNGHHIRFSDPELDKSLKEIEERNKQPYEISRNS